MPAQPFQTSIFIWKVFGKVLSCVFAGRTHPFIVRLFEYECTYRQGIVTETFIGLMGAANAFGVDGCGHWLIVAWWYWPTGGKYNEPWLDQD